MTPADIASLVEEQQAAEGSGEDNDEEESFFATRLREEESERLVAENQALFKNVGNDDLRNFMQQENNNDNDNDNSNDNDNDGNVHGGAEDYEEDEDLEWRSTQTEEAESLRAHLEKWVSGKLYFLRKLLAS